MDSVLELDELKSTLKLQLEMQVSWIDGRLTYQKVHKDRLNSIGSLEQKKLLWIPEIIFDNSQDKVKLRLDDANSDANIKIFENAKGKMAEMSEIHNSKEYHGKEG